MQKATETVPFPWVDSPGISDEQLFLTEKLRQDRCSIRRSGNETGTVAFCILSSWVEVDLFPV
jgi:hypothetical protein